MKIIRYIFVLFVTIVCLFLTGCSGCVKEHTGIIGMDGLCMICGRPYCKDYTVTFLDHDGRVLKVEYLDKHEDATPPTPPQREEYIFLGWNKNFRNIKRSKKIVAVYEKCYVKLRLSKDNKTYEVYELNISKNNNKMLEVKVPNEYMGLPVTAINSDVFSYVNNISKISIPKNIVSIANDSIYGCAALSSIEVNKNNAYYKSIDGNLYTKDGKTLISYATGKTKENFQLPTSVEEISTYAFINSNNLININVESIHPLYKSIKGTLYSKDGKTLIAYPSGKKEEHFNIPSEVTRVDAYAFSACPNLKGVYLPLSVTSIDYNAFRNSNIVLYFENESFSSSSESNFNVYGNSAYQGINDFNLAKINNMYFVLDIENKTAILTKYVGIDESVEIPKQITYNGVTYTVNEIGTHAFCYENLKSVYIAFNITKIYANGFLYCKNLVIYCEHNQQPTYWVKNWYNGVLKVEWGYKK